MTDAFAGPVPAQGPPAAAPPAASVAPPSSATRGRVADRPRWERPAFWALLVLTGALYAVNLSASGYANSFYSAAVQAGSESWKAFFFGSLDAGNAITVDKPPAALWPMALSVRVFGLGSWAILLPEVLMGVATVAVLHRSVRRRFGPAAGLIAGGVLALTPVAALMFRFNNPDALLALLMTVTVACVLRALEAGEAEAAGGGARSSTKWLLAAGAAVGLGFLTKTLQAFLVLPPLALLYAVCAPVRLRRRFGQLALSGLAMVVVGGWWVALVELWPAGSRPYVGGSQHNSFLELTFGYNGLGRISGDETGSVGGGGGGAGGPGGGGGGGWGETGLGRMFNAEVGGQIAWLLPAALLLLLAGLVVTRRAARTDATRAAFLAWGGSLLVTGLVFSFMAGIFHQYYTVALAPYLAALTGMGAVLLWRGRRDVVASAGLALVVVVTAWWAYVLLGRTADYLPWLRVAVLAAGLLAALGLLCAGRAGRYVSGGAALLAVAACLAAPTAYTISTVSEGHQGSIVTAGPAGASRGGGPGGGGPGGAPGGGRGGPGGGGQLPPGGRRPPGANQAPGGQAPNGRTPGGQGQAQNGQTPNGQPQNGQAAPGGTGRGPGGDGGGGGGMGGLLNGTTVGAEARKLVEKDAGDYTWPAVAIGSQNAASYQLATGVPVMAIGGFNGSDPYPTLARLKQYVAEGRVHYFIASGEGMGGEGMGGGPGGGGTSSALTAWVEKTFTKVTAGDATFYDLTDPKA
ncbi:glycosyltransferase family 39 protein [Streptomyces sp. NPDC049954]|uniref:ArnT family glycosyltransferase n=1 Tax=Streptomyces sp. NPDC049954 TaxID=3155779 RepID=UPI00342D5F11